MMPRFRYSTKKAHHIDEPFYFIEKEYECSRHRANTGNLRMERVYETEMTRNQLQIYVYFQLFSIIFKKTAK